MRMVPSGRKMPWWAPSVKDRAGGTDAIGWSSSLATMIVVAPKSVILGQEAGRPARR